MIARLRFYFLAGLVSVAPLAITAWILLQVYRLVRKFTGPFLNHLPSLKEALPDVVLNAAGLLVLLLLVTALGVLAQNVFGVALFRFFERSLGRMPIARIIFETTKQVGEVLLNPHRNAFQQVVLIEYPRRDCFVLGFVTNDDGRQDLIAVFVSTPPNPATGLCLMLPRSEVTVLPLSVEDGVRLVVSGGALLTRAQVQAMADGAEKLRAGRVAGGAATRAAMTDPEGPPTA